MRTSRTPRWWPPLPRTAARMLGVLAVGYALVLAAAWLAWVWYDLFPDPRQQGASLSGIYLLVAGLPWTLVTGPLASLLPSVAGATVIAVSSLLLDVLCTRWLLAAIARRRRARR